MEAIVWMLISLDCGHTNGCDFVLEQFETRAECIERITIPATEDSVWFRGRPARINERAICLPLADYAVGGRN